MAILTARDAAELLAPLFADRAGEALAVVYLDARHEPIARETREAAGAAIALPLREIFWAALGHGAVGLVIAHNHPSGDPAPSAADVRLTRRFAMACDVLGLALHDHLIFAGGQCESFRRLGLL